MYNRKYSVALKLLALILAVVFVIPVNINAQELRASDYLSSYNAYPYAAGAGKVQIWFTVKGTRAMDDIGALTIQVYESTDNTNWTWVQSYSNANYPRMLGHDTVYYSGHVDYQGRTGRYYKAYVCLWAGKDGGGDTRYFWTGSVKA